MSMPRIRRAAVAVLALLAGAVPTWAATPAQIAANRRASLNGILTTFPANAIAAQRVTCMMGEEPNRVVAGRRAGKDFIPDAADTCVAVLVRTAHDGRLPELYRTLLTQLGGDAAAAGSLPVAIANAVLNGTGKVALGNGKATDVPPPLAFDAGFTVAYLQRDARAASTDTAQLKLLTEACLGVKQDAGTCFSAGYAQAGQALNAGR